MPGPRIASSPMGTFDSDRLHLDARRQTG